MTDMM